jgi:hypothetical protein
LQQIENAISRIKSHKRREISSNVISELTFGFCPKMLIPGVRNINEIHFWRKSLHRVFPHARKDSKLKAFKRVEIYKPIHKANEFRNRIAHHAPIYHEPLIEHLESIQTVCGWMSPSARQMAEALDTCAPLLKLLSRPDSSSYIIDNSFP